MEVLVLNSESRCFGLMLISFGVFVLCTESDQPLFKALMIVLTEVEIQYFDYSFEFYGPRSPNPPYTCQLFAGYHKQGENRKNLLKLNLLNFLSSPTSGMVYALDCSQWNR